MAWRRFVMLRIRQHHSMRELEEVAVILEWRDLGGV